MDKKPILTVTSNDAGQRLDNYLLKHRKQLDKGTCYKLIRKGQIRVNGKRCKPLLKLLDGDQVRLPPFLFFIDAPTLQIPPEMQQQLSQCIIAEDDQYMVLNKPAGMPVHAGSGHAYGVIEIINSIPECQLVQLAHRIDIDTSGCLLLAKSRPALLLFQQALQQDQVVKTYAAVLAGNLKQVTQVDQPLDTENRVNGIRTVVVSAAGKPANSTFTPIRWQADLTFVNCVITTGRTHQIRVHAKHLEAPVLGDILYGKAQKELPRKLYLHAQKLQFGDRSYAAGVPTAFEQLFN